jgi:hypothetical protein
MAVRICSVCGERAENIIHSANLGNARVRFCLCTKHADEAFADMSTLWDVVSRLEADGVTEPW